MPPPGWKDGIVTVMKGHPDKPIEFKEYAAMGPFGPVKIVWRHKETIGSHDDVTAWCQPRRNKI